MKLSSIIPIILLQFSHYTFAQIGNFKKIQEKKDKEYKETNPPILKDVYPLNSLGEKLQTYYKAQAAEACKIERSNERLFIPTEIVLGYTDDALRNTQVYEMPLSATNLLFLTLTDADIAKINDGTYTDSEYIEAKRVIGLRNNLIDFGGSHPTAAAGFKSLFYQKSCGSYFNSSIETEVKPPLAELQASLSAESKKLSSITSISGKFFSPLYLLFQSYSRKSIYAHMLLWEIYAEDFKQNENSELLIENGKYISEMNATLINRSNSSEQSLDMNTRLSAGISAGIFSASGQVNAGLDQKTSFSLKDFTTYIHKKNDGSLEYAISSLPSASDINEQLQNSTQFEGVSSFTGFLSHLTKTTISRVLSGVPPNLCKEQSWFIGEFDANIWVSEPTVESKAVIKERTIPDCVCTISGHIKKTAIDNAISNQGLIDLDMTMVHKDTINGEILALNISEPSLKVTDSPKILPVSEVLVNAGRFEAKSTQKKWYNYSAQLVIDDTGVEIKNPLEPQGFQVEYTNKDQEKFGFMINSTSVTGQVLELSLKTTEHPKDFIVEEEVIVPIKVKFTVNLKDQGTAPLVTNTLNLKVPKLVKDVGIISKVDDEIVAQLEADKSEDQ